MSVMINFVLLLGRERNEVTCTNLCLVFRQGDSRELSLYLLLDCLQLKIALYQSDIFWWHILPPYT